MGPSIRNGRQAYVLKGTTLYLLKLEYPANIESEVYNALAPITNGVTQKTTFESGLCIGQVQLKNMAARLDIKADGKGIHKGRA